MTEKEYMHFLNRVERRLDMPSAEKQQVMRELSSHFEEIREELVSSGMRPSRAKREAGDRLGSPEDIASRLNAVHNSAGWKSAVLSIIPFLVSIMVISSQILKSNVILMTVLISSAAVLLIGSIRELIMNRRPIWLSSWLAGAIPCVLGLLSKLHLLANGRFNESSITICLFGILTLVASLKAHRWRRIAIPLSLICAIFSYYAFSPGERSIIVFVVVVSIIILFVYFARYVFELHPYGNGARASLFILTFITAGFAFIQSGAKMDIGLLYGRIVAEVLCACGVMWFTRVPRRRNKINMIYACLALCFIGLSIPTHLHEATQLFSSIKGLVGFAFGIYAIGWYIAIPLLYENPQTIDTSVIASPTQTA